MPPTLVGVDLIGSAMTLRSISAQTGMVLGPALRTPVRGLADDRLPARGRRLPADPPSCGRLLLTVVLLYGACIVVFGLSRSYPLSLAALAVSGFVDLYSVNIRSTTVALASPDRLRGRVNAVEMVFISASNQLGYFESGLAAFLVGTIPAVVGGGVATMLIALSWQRFFPALSTVDRLQDITPPVARAAAEAQLTSELDRALS